MIRTYINCKPFKCLNNEKTPLLKVGEIYNCEEYFDNGRILFYNSEFGCIDAYNLSLFFFRRYFISLKDDRKLKLEKIKNEGSM